MFFSFTEMGIHIPIKGRENQFEFKMTYPDKITVQMIDVCMYVRTVLTEKGIFSTKNNCEIPHFIILEPP